MRTPYFCAGCPHNYLDRGARRLARLCRHRLPLHGALDGPRDHGLHADGRRRRQLDRRGAVLQARRTCSRTSATARISIPARWRSARRVAAGVNITFKILYNDAVAMTGGQPLDGGLTVRDDRPQVLAEGVDDGRRRHRRARTSIRIGAHARAACACYHRRELDAGAEASCARSPGVSVLIYDQTCAAEKRRRRKRGTVPIRDKRVFINQAVCEGCGDCGVKSNCVAVQPLETEFGRKRAIDQSACNKDFSCLNGFCPSFVTRARRQGAQGAARPSTTAASPRCRRACPSRKLPTLDQPLHHAGHRHRRHRRGDRLGRAGAGRAPRRQGLRLHRHDRPRAEGRRGRLPHARSPSAPDADPRHPRRRRAAPTWCSAAISWSTAANKVLETIKPDHTAVVHSTHEMHDRRLHAQRQPQRSRRGAARAIDRQARAGKAPRARSTRTTPRCELFGDSHRRQHVPAGLRLSERARAHRLGRDDRAGHRAQRRGRRDEPQGLPLRPAGGARPAAVRATDRAGASAVPQAADAR